MKPVLTFLLLFLLYHKASATDFATTDSSYKVLYIFTGSDWCTNCKTMKQRLLDDSSFLKELDKRRIQIEIIDFPKKFRQSDSTISYNKALALKLGFTGIFPSLYLVDKYFKNNLLIEYSGEYKDEFIQILNEL